MPGARSKGCSRARRPCFKCSGSSLDVNYNQCVPNDTCHHCARTLSQLYIVQRSTLLSSLLQCGLSVTILHGIRASLRLLPVLCNHANMAETHSDTISSTRGDTRQPVLQPQNQVDRNTHRFNHPIVTAPQLNRIEISLPETSRIDGAQNYQI
jgi:hypothetical protein